VIVTDDYLSYLRLVKLRKDQKVIQIWHASGAYKKFGLDSATLSHEVETKTHQQYHAVVVSSEEVRRPYASAFGLPLEKIKALGIPGTDVFFQENTLEEDLYQAYPELRNKKIILYAPTFRENDWGERIPLDTGINWENLNNSLGEDEVFLIKRHPVMKEKLCKGIYDKIVDLTSAPLYSLMMASSVLITDYSSVIFEYSLLGKPIIFYCPDLYSYERDFYLDYPEDLPGVLVESSDELIQAIISVEQIQDDVLEEFKRKQMGACDGNSTKRVVALIKSYLS
jgi:CDP-glycerol glycerophosphotransferase (TagB/SpsB family)